MSNHATVMRDGYEVPLIGIPATATEEKCDCCGDIVHLKDAVVTNDGVLCPKCAKGVEA